MRIANLGNQQPGDEPASSIEGIGLFSMTRSYRVYPQSVYSLIVCTQKRLAGCRGVIPVASRGTR